MARRSKGFGQDIGKQITADVRRVAQQALREAAKQVLIELQERSPNWSGTFRDSWYVESSDGTKAIKADGPTDYGYNLFNVPRINTRGPVTLYINNSASYATQAMDLEGGVFLYPGFEPKGDVVLKGTRVDDIRGDIETGGSGRNRATAPLDWYSTYMDGGSFRKSFGKGARLGFQFAAKEGYR